jgi:hypothetical protein
MGPVTKKAKNEDCKKKEMIMVEVKKEIIEKYEHAFLKLTLRVLLI